MKQILFATVLLFATKFNQAQTKVFKEVSEEVSSQIKTIRQDGALVGYLVFTQLEKASADSFNYKITILDENLNEIGAINFREQKLNLQSVSFEQDVLALAYLKSNFIGVEFKNARELKRARDDAKSFVFTQFVDLNGKIIGSNTIKAEIKPETSSASLFKTIGGGRLKHGLQLNNISQKGFALLYGDDNKTNLLIYNSSGKQIWQKSIKEDAEEFALLTSGHNAYVLLKRNEKIVSEGGYEVLGFNTADSSTFPKYTLKDKHGSDLKVLSFDNDPVSGKPFLTGNIINSDTRPTYLNAKHIAKGGYTGVFTINLDGPKKADIKEKFSYWSDGSVSSISKRGLQMENGMYARQVRSFRDYEGNTYFVGSSFVKKTRWGAIAASVVTAPLLFPPVLLLSQGTNKSKITDVTVLKQNEKGGLSVDKSIDRNDGKYYPAKMPLFTYDNRSFSTVANPDTKTNFIVVDDWKEIVIYNVNKKQVVRTIPHRDGNIVTSVYSAKEGHVMVSEYNRKEKYTRFSIEAL